MIHHLLSLENTQRDINVTSLNADPTQKEQTAFQLLSFEGIEFKGLKSYQSTRVAITMCQQAQANLNKTVIDVGNCNSFMSLATRIF